MYIYILQYAILCSMIWVVSLQILTLRNHKYTYFETSSFCLLIDIRINFISVWFSQDIHFTTLISVHI